MQPQSWGCWCKLSPAEPLTAPPASIYTQTRDAPIILEDLHQESCCAELPTGCHLPLYHSFFLAQLGTAQMDPAAELVHVHRQTRLLLVSNMKAPTPLPPPILYTSTDIQWHYFIAIYSKLPNQCHGEEIN